MGRGGPLGGDVLIEIDGETLPARLTLGALAELEDRLGEEGLGPLLERFEGGAVRSKDIAALLAAGLRGGGWPGTEADLMHARLGGGATTAARHAAELLIRAFRLPE